MRTYGEPAPVLAVHAGNLSEPASWTVRSDTFPDIWYEVTWYPDGHWGCTCPGFGYQARADGLCKHIDVRKAVWERDPLALLL